MSQRAQSHALIGCPVSDGVRHVCTARMPGSEELLLCPKFWLVRQPADRNHPSDNVKRLAIYLVVLWLTCVYRWGPRMSESSIQSSLTLIGRILSAVRARSQHAKDPVMTWAELDQLENAYDEATSDAATPPITATAWGQRGASISSGGLTDTEQAEYRARYQREVIDRPVPREIIRRVQHEIEQGKRQVLHLRRVR
jgi:hypothetical protein